LTDEFQNILQRYTLSHVKTQGLTALTPVSSNGDPGKQIADIQSLVALGAEGVILVPGDSAAIKPALDFLSSKQIPAVSIDIAPVGAKVAMIVRADNYRMGQDACAWMGAKLHGKGTVLSMQGDYKTTNGRDRGQGFKKCMDKKFPKIKVIERPTYWLADKAAEVANTVVATNKQLDGIYMASDTTFLAPVLSALKKAGRTAKVGRPGHVYLISIDGSPYGLQQVRAGRLDALLSQPLDLYAKWGVTYLKRAKQGEKFKTGPTTHRSRIIMVGGNPEDLLPAPLVTKANASSKTLWGNSVR
jgi:ribose transport system substrate-binding protein